jgi:hypothetical protein
MSRSLSESGVLKAYGVSFAAVIRLPDSKGPGAAVSERRIE